MKVFALFAAVAFFAIVPLSSNANAGAPAPCSGSFTHTITAPMNTVIFGNPLGHRIGQAPDSDGLESFYVPVTIPATGCIASAHVNSDALGSYAVSMHWYGADWKHYEPVPGQGDQCDSFRLDTADFSCPVADTNIAWGVVDGMLGAEVSVTITLSSPPSN